MQCVNSVTVLTPRTEARELARERQGAVRGALSTGCAHSPDLGPLAFCTGEEVSIPKSILPFVFFASPKDAFRAVKKRIVGNKNFHEVMLALTVNILLPLSSIHLSMISSMTRPWSAESCFSLVMSSRTPIHAWVSHLKTQKKRTMGKLFYHPHCW